MTKLLWLIDSLTVGGAESLVVPFARKLDRSQYALTVVCLTSIAGNAIEKELSRDGVRVVNLGARNLRDLGAFRRLLALIRSEGIELLHAHLTYASIWGAVAARTTSVPCVATLHVAPPRNGRTMLRDRLMRFVLNRWAARVIAVSGALRDMYLASGGIRADKLVVAHNGIEVERFTPSPTTDRIAVTVSVLRPGKGIEVLLAAATQLDDVTLRIVGDGPMRDEWAALAQKLGVADRVEWLGYRNDVQNVLPGAGVFVLPSLDDAFPTVLLEAMAAGLPVVATRVGGIPEIVVENGTGRLVPPGDANALALAIRSLLDSDTAPLRAAARTRAAALFSTEAWISRLTQIYREVVR